VGHDTDAMTNPLSRDLALVRGLIVVWVITLVLGFLAVNVPGALAAQNEVAPERGIFTAVNASTLTGFTQGFARPGSFAWPVQVVMLAQILTGALLTLIGGGTLLARLLKLPHSTRDIAIASLAIIGLSTLLGAASVGAGESFLQAISRGLGSLAGAGETVAGPLASDDLLLHAVFLPLGIVGSLGVIVILEGWHAVFSRQRISGHALRVLAMGAIAYLVGMLLLTPLLGGYSKSSILLSNNLVAAALGVGNASTPLAQLPRGADWVLVAVALFGVGTLGTQGAFAFAWTKTLPERFVPKLLLWIGCELGIMLVALVLLLQAEPALAPDRAVLLALNATLNVGLSHGAVSITGNGLLILSVLMVVGRLLPVLVVMSWVSDANRKV
jgi:hypothetical protein